MSIIRRIKDWLFKEQFRPSFLGIIVNPFYFGRKSILNNIINKSHHITGKTLDIGCGSKPYSGLFNSSEYTGIDVESSGHIHATSKVDIFYNGTEIPFADSHFDSVVCFEVLEVIFNPERFLKEAHRVLKPGGKALFTVPFIWDEHEQPFDYARYSSFGLRFLFEKSGFKVIESNKYLDDPRLLVLLANAYVYKIVKRYIPSKISLLLILPFTFLNNLFGHIFYLFPHNPDFYFGNIIVLEKPD
jgi:SAM-dependent methyltransferase